MSCYVVLEGFLKKDDTSYHMFFQLHLISSCLYTVIIKKDEQYMHSDFLSARLTSHMHAQTEAC